MQIDTNKTLGQLYEEGVIKIGTRIYMEVPKGRKYVSKEDRDHSSFCADHDLFLLILQQ